MQKQNIYFYVTNSCEKFETENGIKKIVWDSKETKKRERKLQWCFYSVFPLYSD